MAMTSEQTQGVLTAYAQALLSQGDFGQYMSEDVTYTILNSGRLTQGRATVVQAILDDHAPAQEIRVRGVVVGAGQALLEAEYVRQDGSALPYAVAYDFADRQVAALRLYFAGDFPG